MKYERRDFLKVSGLGLAGIFFVPLLQGCDEQIITPLGEGRTASFITPTSRFFVQNGGQGSIESWTEPTFASTADWSLVVKNQAGSEKSRFTFDDIMRFAAEPDMERTILKTIECVLQSEIQSTVTGFTGNAYWTGIPLTRLLDEAGVNYNSTSLKHLFFHGADGFFNSILPARLREDSSYPVPLLVYKMNGEPLPPEHGFPVRLIMPEGYGYTNVKWLTEIRELNITVSTSARGTYQEQGFVDDGIIRTNSRSINLFEQISLPSGEVAITGFALSGFAPIERVDISIDGGEFMQGEITPFESIRENEGLPPNIEQIVDQLSYPFLGVWTFWTFRWDAEPGEHVVRIRATDAAGNVQPTVDETAEDGITEITTYHVTVT